MEGKVIAASVMSSILTAVLVVACTAGATGGGFGGDDTASGGGTTPPAATGAGRAVVELSHSTAGANCVVDQVMTMNCCPPGFSPVGIEYGSDLVCLED